METKGRDQRMKDSIIPIITTLDSSKPLHGIPSTEEVGEFCDREFVRKPLHREKVRYIVGYRSGSVYYPYFPRRFSVYGEIKEERIEQVPICEDGWKLHPRQEKEIKEKILAFIGLQDWQVRLYVGLKESDHNSISINILISETGEFNE